MFSWLKRKPARLQPESRWVVSLDSDRISVRDDAGAMKTIAKEELTGVAIETNDSGPWGADVWWLLFNGGGELACAFPQGASGERAAIDYISALPAFDHGAMIQAMTSTDNAVFPVWRKAA